MDTCLYVRHLVLELQAAIHSQGLEGIQDGAIASAPTEIAIQGTLYLAHSQGFRGLLLPVCKDTSIYYR